MPAWRLLKHRYMNFYELHGFPASWQQWSGLGQMTGGSVQECNCMVHSPGPGLCYPQDSSEVTQFFFYLGFLWGLCSWSSSVNSLFSLVTGMGRKYMPGDSSLQIALSFSDLLLVITISCCCWHYLDTFDSQIWTFLIFKRLYMQLGYLFSLNVQNLFKVLFFCLLFEQRIHLFLKQ